MSHTPEPWIRKPFVSFDGKGMWLDADDYLRAQDCVNGCAGLNPAAYRSVVEALRDLHSSLAGIAIDHQGSVNPLLAQRLEMAKQTLALAEQP